MSSRALAANLVAEYEGNQPNLMTVVLNAHGFTDLLEQVSFLQKIGHQDANIVASTRAARDAVTKQAIRLEGLESRDRTLTEQVLSQRNQVAGLQAALISRQISEERRRDRASAQLSGLNARLRALEAKAAAKPPPPLGPPPPALRPLRTPARVPWARRAARAASRPTPAAWSRPPRERRRPSRR